MTEFSFGPYVLDTTTRQLSRCGRNVPVTPKAFQLLKVLLLRRPAAVSKVEIMNRLWPGSFVSEGNVASLVSEIRQVLGGERIDHVRTVHGFGYAFCADATQVPASRRQGTQAPCRLIEQTGADPRTFAVHEGQTYIGRSSECTVRFSSPTVSRKHARITVASGQAVIEDLGSRNGTYVNGARIRKSEPLPHGAGVKVGAIWLMFHATEVQEQTTKDLPTLGELTDAIPAVSRRARGPRKS